MYEAPEQAVRSRTKSKVSVIAKVGDEEKNFCVQPITPTLRGILCVVLMTIIWDLILFFLFRKGLSHPRLISLQLSKERNFLRQRQQKETRKRKKPKKDLERSRWNWSARCWESRRNQNRSRNSANFIRYFSGLSVEKQDICFFTFILKLILTIKI